MSSILSAAVTILEFVIAFSLLMFFHEFGHFIVSKAFGIEVEEFGFGFPPKMVNLFKFKGTQISLNWIPFGAFVRPKAENDPTVKGGFAAANPWKRLSVFLAGPAMNLLLGIVIFSVVFSLSGAPNFRKVQVLQVNSGSPAQTAGFQVGDQITAVAGQTITSMDQVSTITKLHLGQQIQVTILRGATTLTLTIIPRLVSPTGEGPMGLVMTNPVMQLNFFQAMPYSVQLTGDTIVQVVTLPVKLIRGELSSSQARLVSPVGLYDIYSQVRASAAPAEANHPGLAVLNILWFFANISIILGISNLLPIPAVDGGHILFLLPELLFRKRVPPNLENAVHTIGFFLLILLMTFLLVQDIVNPVVLP
jgi:regulator of sigma E protease